MAEKKKSKWIAGAVKHPGVETAAAKRAGETTHQYMEQHKNDPGTAGKRARLGLTFEGMHHGDSKTRGQKKPLFG